MKEFEVKSVNKIHLVIVVLIGIVVLGGVAMSQLVWIIKNDYGVPAVIATLVVIFILFVSARIILQKVYLVNIDTNKLTITCKETVVYGTPLSEIVMLTYKDLNNECQLVINTSRQVKPMFHFNVSKGSTVLKDIVDEVISNGDYGVTMQTKTNGIYTDYINKQVVESNQQVLSGIRVAEKEAKTKKKVWVLIPACFVLLLLFVPFFLNPKKFYEVTDDKVFYGDKELVGVNPKEVKTLGYTVILDSTNVYFKGEILEWADRATFQTLQRGLYMDKYGLYQETTGLYTKHKIVPMDGDYDKDSFHAVGNGLFFKDMNHVYELEISLTDKNKLQVLDIEGLDVATFEELDYSSRWYKDKSLVYFNTWNDFKICKEIDVQSFEVLSYTTAKDKNNVYYLTQGLKSEDSRATKNESYAILKGADAPSFRMIDQRNYVDKNKIWVIREEGEEVKQRSDIN